MGSSYNNVKVGQNITDFVRLFFLDVNDDPVDGLVIGSILRSSTGAVLNSGNCTALSGSSPGWYVPPSYVFTTPGLFTIEYNPPAGYLADSDSIFASVHSTDDIGADTELLRSMIAGNWKILNNQMIFYKDGEPSTVLRVFDLFDKNAVPNDRAVFERRKNPP